MSEILLIGNPEKEISQLRSSLEHNFKDYKVRYTKPDKDSIQDHLSGSTKMTVFNLGQLPKESPEHIQTIRDMGYSDSILMLAGLNDPKDLSEIQKTDDVTVLPKPFENNDLIHLSRKILNDEKVCQRRYPRFSMDEVVGLEAFGVSGKVGARMLKLSKGGALLKLEGFSELYIGDIIQVHVQLRELERYHRMTAQIVNTEEDEKILTGEHFGISWLTTLGQKQVAA